MLSILHFKYKKHKIYQKHHDNMTKAVVAVYSSIGHSFQSFNKSPCILSDSNNTIYENSYSEKQ